MTSLPILVDDTRHSTPIEWVHMPGYVGVTWNVGKGCLRVSPGCGRSGEFKGGCYAERQAIRMSGPGGAYEGLVRSTPNGPRWTGKVRFDVETLQQPLRWRKPHMVFVDSMSDLFYEEFTNEQIAAVFGVMAATPQHLYLVLTKRAERMRQWFGWLTNELGMPSDCDYVDFVAGHAWRLSGRPIHGNATWPLPNVILGVSVESRAFLPRIDELRKTPAALRFVSLEPLLEDVSDGLDLKGIDQAVIGGEGGPGSAPFDLAWARNILPVCRRDGCAYFFKQAGANPMQGLVRLRLSGKGGDLSELPEDLRVREYPTVAHG